MNKFSATGVKTPFASSLRDPRGVAVDRQDNVFVTVGGLTSSTAVYKYASDGTQSTFASVQCPIGIAIDSANNVYVSQGTRCVSLGGPPFPIDILKFTPGGSSSVFTTAVTGPTSLAVDPAGNLYVSDTTQSGPGAVYIFAPNGDRTVLASGVGPQGIAIARSGAAHPAFFSGETPLSNGVYNPAFPNNGNVFGYYSYLNDPRYIYHFDLGYEYLFDGNDDRNGIYFYDFTSGSFFYTNPSSPFPYLYDFTLNATLYYYQGE